MADQIEVRIHDMADSASRQSAATKGPLSERSSIRPKRPDPDFSHQLRLDSGRTVVVREGSGTAYAESTGRAGLAGAKPWLDPAAYEEQADRSIRLPLLVGLGVAAAIVGVARWRERSGAQRKRLPQARVAPANAVGIGVGGRHVGHQSKVGLGPYREMANEEPIHCQSAR